ncbi:hypothetical protein PHMEG_00035964 [Phytophthora megakarya]|uniref:Uncharacterized protein n=1 Tax=Phytophthora megakarya TaxID=4795 RepID=A0A225UP62_9STRA|nr:hypothetical protein PHMEG_00035964 [Phytophthora megakarya]
MSNDFGPNCNKIYFTDVVMTIALRAPGPKTLKPKRVRREKLELTYLRDLVGTMEDKLTLLNSKRLHQLNYKWRDNGVAVDCSSPHNSASWMDCAAEQLKGRAIAVEKNQKLRYSVRGQIEVATKLKTLLHKFVVDKRLSLEGGKSALSSTSLKFWDLAVEAEEDIFAEQLVNVARLRLKLQQQVQQNSCEVINFSWGLSRGNMTVKRLPTEDHGVVIEMHGTTTLPFSLDVTARAYWRFFCVEHGQQGGDVADLSTNTLARSFSLRLEFEGLISEATGKYTCQCLVTDDEITIAWVEWADVLEFGGIKFEGLQYQKRSYMKLHSVEDKVQQTQAFINSAHRSHNKLDKLVTQHMSHLLLEEDWKATFG